MQEHQKAGHLTIFLLQLAAQWVICLRHWVRGCVGCQCVITLSSPPTKTR